MVLNSSGVMKNELHRIMILEPVEASRNSFVPAITALHCLSAVKHEFAKAVINRRTKELRKRRPVTEANPVSTHSPTPDATRSASA